MKPKPTTHFTDGSNEPGLAAEKPAVLLIGATGGPNFGDEAILDGWIRFIPTIQPSLRIICDGYNVANLSSFLNGRAAIQSPELSLWALVRQLSGGSFAQQSLASIRNSSDASATARELATLAQGFREANIAHIHFVGGGYFNALWPTHYHLLFVATTIGQLNQIPVTASGQGLLPSSAGEADEVCSLFAALDHVDVRDSGSLGPIQFLPGHKTSHTGDDALLHFANGPGWLTRQTEHPTAVICVQNDLFPGDEEFCELFHESLFKRLTAAGIHHIAMVEAMAGDITELPHKLRDVCRQLNIEVRAVSTNELLREGLPVHPQGVFITSRYHPHFFGAAAGCRGIALASNPYYVVKHQALADMGSTWPAKALGDHQSLNDLLDAVLDPGFTLPDPTVLATWVNKKKDVASRIFQQDTHPTRQLASYLWTALNRTVADIDTANRDLAIQHEKLEMWATRHALQFDALKAANQAYRQLAESSSHQIQTLNAKLNAEHNEARHQSLQQRLAAQAREDQLNARLDEERAKLHEERVRLYEAEAQIRRFHRSLSWRVTQPLRTLAAYLRELKALFLTTNN